MRKSGEFQILEAKSNSGFMEKLNAKPDNMDLVLADAVAEAIENETQASLNKSDFNKVINSQTGSYYSSMFDESLLTSQSLDDVSNLEEDLSKYLATMDIVNQDFNKLSSAQNNHPSMLDEGSIEPEAAIPFKPSIEEWCASIKSKRLLYQEWLTVEAAINTNSEPKITHIDQKSISPEDDVFLGEDLSKYLVAMDLINHDFNKIASTQNNNYFSMSDESLSEIEEMFLVEESRQQPKRKAEDQGSSQESKRARIDDQMDRVKISQESKNERKNSVIPSVRSTRQFQFHKPPGHSMHDLTDDSNPVSLANNIK